MTLGILVGAVLHFMCARWLGQRRNRSFCFVVACLSCVNIPLGTILGIFTILVLNRLTPGAYLNR